MKKNLIRRISLLCLLCFMFAAAAFAAEKAPRRIALVPTITETGLHYPNAETYCNEALYESLRIPLNDILARHEYITQEAIAAALPELAITKKRHKLTPSRLKEAADELQADLIVAFVIADADEIRSHTWSGNTLLYSYVNLRLIGYDRQKETFIQLKRRAFYHDEESPHGSIEALTREAANYLLEKAAFKQNIFPLSKQE